MKFFLVYLVVVVVLVSSRNALALSSSSSSATTVTTTTTTTAETETAVTDTIEYPFDIGARCESYIGDPLDRIVCAPYITSYNTSIYVPSNTNQHQLLESADYYVKFLNSYGNDACKVQPSYRTLCSFFFIKCIQVNVSTIGIPPINASTSINTTLISIPQFTCRESCQTSMDLCGVGSNLYDCAQNSSTSLGDRPLYPPSSLVEMFNLTSFNYSYLDNNGTWSYIYDEQSCFNSSDLSLNTNETVNTGWCQAPLIYRKSTDRYYDEMVAGYTFVTSTSDCLIPCPAPAFSHDQWDSFYSLVDTLSMMSAIVSLFMIVTYGLLNREHTNYEKILLFQFTSLFIRSFSGVIITIAGGTKKNMCPEPGRSMTSIDPLCVASGILFYGFSLNAIMWWSFLVFDLWCVVRKYRQLKLLYFLIGSTIITIVMTVFATIKGKYIADKGNVICWISDNDYVDELFWIPMGILIGVCSILIVWIIIDVYRLINRTNVGWEMGKKFVYAQIGPLGYIIVFYVAYVYVFVYNRTYHLSYLELKEKSAVAYFDCILNSQIGGYDPNTCLVVGPQIAWFTIFISLLQLFGLFTIFYAFNSKFIGLWKESLAKLSKWTKSKINNYHLNLTYNPSSSLGNTATTATKSSSGDGSTIVTNIDSTFSLGAEYQVNQLQLSPTFDQLSPNDISNNIDNDNNNNNDDDDDDGNDDDDHQQVLGEIELNTIQPSLSSSSSSILLD